MHTMNDQKAGFAAVSTARPKGSSKKEHRRIKAPKKVADAIAAYVKAKAEIKALEAIVKLRETEIKSFGAKSAVGMIENGRDVESVIVEGNGDSLMYTVQDVFAKVTEDNVADLRLVLGKKSIVDVEVHMLNADVLALHRDKVIAALTALDIPEEDKQRLLLTQKGYAYTFALNDIGQVAKRLKLEVAEVFDTVQPVQQLKFAKK